MIGEEKKECIRVGDEMRGESGERRGNRARRVGKAGRMPLSSAPSLLPVLLCLTKRRMSGLLQSLLGI